MLKLPNVTLIMMTGKDLEKHQEILELSSKGIEFGEKKVIFMPSIKNINDWNYSIIYDLPNYIATDFCILIHPDGYVVNPHLWNDEWLTYDYIGAPWPLPSDDYSYRDECGNIVRVGNSVSLRSKKLMQRVAKFPWREYYGNTNEDGFISVHHHDELTKEGYRFADINVAKYFSKEHTILENEDIKETFAFHSI